MGASVFVSFDVRSSTKNEPKAITERNTAQ